MSRIGLFRVLHLRQFRRQPVRVVLAVVAVSAGVSITVASLLLVSSLMHSVAELLRAYAGPAPLRVVGPLTRGGLDEAVTDNVAGVRGVEAVVPMVQAVTIAEGYDGREMGIVAIGVDCRIEALVGAFGCEDQALKPVRPDAPVLISSTLARELEGGVVRTNAGRVRIDGVAVNDLLDDMNSGRVAVFDLPTAQRVFAREGRLDALYVQPGPREEIRDLQKRVQSVIGDWNAVLRRDELGPADGIGGPLIPILGLTVVMALGLSGLLVYNIVSLSMAERRRDFAVAGAVGATPRALTTGVLADAGLLGLLGGGLGALGGIGFGRLIIDQASAVVIEQATGMQVGLHLSALVLIAGVSLGAITSLAASYVPARRARRIDLAAEIHGRTARLEETPGRARRRLAMFVIAGLGAIVLSYIAQRDGSIQRWQPPLSALALGAAGVTLFAAVGAAAPLLLELLLRPLRSTGGPFRVAVSNLVANPRRTSVVATAAGAAVGLACVLASLGPATRDSVRANWGEAADGRVWVSTLSANNSGSVDARLSPVVREALASIPGVGSLEEGPCVLVGDDAGLVNVCADDGSNLAPFEPIVGRVGRRELEQGNAIFGPGAARSRGLRPGSTFRLATPTGFVDVRVAGIWQRSQSNGYSVTVSTNRFEELFGPQPSTSVYLRPAPGVSEDELARRVEAAKLDPDLYALTSREYADQLATEQYSQVTPFWTMQRILLFVALIATLSTLLLVGVQRRRELGVLGAVGFGPGGLARMTAGEGIGAALAGGLLGVVASLGLFEVFRNAGFAAVAVEAPFRFEVPSAAVAVGLAVAVVAIGSLLPAWRTARLPIVEAIRDE